MIRNSSSCLASPSLCDDASVIMFCEVRPILFRRTRYGQKGVEPRLKGHSDFVESFTASHDHEVVR